MKTALREVCHTFRPSIRLTSHQSMLLCDLPAEARGPLEEMLRKHGVRLSEEISNVRRWSMACVAYPTCGLAVTESERALPGMIDQLEVELAKLGLDREDFTLRMTGCPNGCAGRTTATSAWLEKPSASTPYLSAAACWATAEFHLQRFGAGRRSGLDAGAAVHLLQERSPGRRNLRRLLPPPRRRCITHLDRPIRGADSYSVSFSRSVILTHSFFVVGSFAAEESELAGGGLPVASGLLSGFVLPESLLPVGLSELFSSVTIFSRHGFLFS